MFYSTWLPVAAVAGWATGKITGNDGFGTGADLLLGITGAFVVRWSLENLGISLANVYLLLFSIWGAAALPAVVRLAIRRHKRLKTRSRLQLVYGPRFISNGLVPAYWGGAGDSV